MGNITNALKQAAVNGKIEAEKAIQIGTHADELLTRSVDILKDIYKHHGLFIQGEIDVLIADITRIKSRNQVYFHEKEPDGQ